ncbi:MAG: Imm42 family immunity protein [Candidatus Methylacidiphilales bacterium]
MIAGDPSRFAIESSISVVWERRGMELGYFLFHVCGNSYGIKAIDASALGNAYDSVKECIEERGTHTSPFVNGTPAGELARVSILCLYAPDQEENSFFGHSYDDCEAIYRNNRWKSCGECFDDLSDFLIYDWGDKVRFIAFKKISDQYMPECLSEIWIDSDEFYSILNEWKLRYDIEYNDAEISLDTHMLIGNPDVFALESSISVAYKDAELRALGFFRVHLASIDGYAYWNHDDRGIYGLRGNDANYLATPYDSVGRILKEWDEGIREGELLLYNANEAGDDSRIYFQLVDNNVRIIAEKHHDPSHWKQIWVDADEFYDVLESWHDDFEAQWNSAEKI